MARGAGGPGWRGTFLIGLVGGGRRLPIVLNQVQVTASFWRFGRTGGFGLTLLPMSVGVASLFYDGKSVVGWLLTLVGATVILAGVLMNMDMYFRPTCPNTLMMLGLLFGGIGLIARSLR